MGLALFIALLLIISTSLVHYASLRIASGWSTAHTASPPRLIAIVLATFVAHFIAIWFYAFAYMYMVTDPLQGHLSGDFNGGTMEFFYYSAVSYSSLGLGDIWPHGHLRFLTSIEAINGLFLIGWSVTFTYPVLNACCHRDTRAETFRGAD